jgi:hypothetical protein
MSNLAISFGELTTLSLGGSTVANVLSIEHSGIKGDQVDATALGSTVKTSRTNTAIDMGEITFTVQHVASLGYAALVEAGTPLTAVLKFYSGSTLVETWTWTATSTGLPAGAIPMSYKMTGMKENSNVEGELVLKMTVAPVIS